MIGGFLQAKNIDQLEVHALQVYKYNKMIQYTEQEDHPLARSA